MKKKSFLAPISGDLTETLKNLVKEDINRRKSRRRSTILNDLKSKRSSFQVSKSNTPKKSEKSKCSKYRKLPSCTEMETSSLELMKDYGKIVDLKDNKITSKTLRLLKCLNRPEKSIKYCCYALISLMSGEKAAIPQEFLLLKDKEIDWNQMRTYLKTLSDEISSDKNFFDSFYASKLDEDNLMKSKHYISKALKKFVDYKSPYSEYFREIASFTQNSINFFDSKRKSKTFNLENPTIEEEIDTINEKPENMQIFINNFNYQKEVENAKTEIISRKKAPEAKEAPIDQKYVKNDFKIFINNINYNEIPQKIQRENVEKNRAKTAFIEKNEIFDPAIISTNELKEINSMKESLVDHNLTKYSKIALKGFPIPDQNNELPTDEELILLEKIATILKKEPEIIEKEKEIIEKGKEIIEKEKEIIENIEKKENLNETINNNNEEKINLEENKMVESKKYEIENIKKSVKFNENEIKNEINNFDFDLIRESQDLNDIKISKSLNLEEIKHKNEIEDIKLCDSNSITLAKSEENPLKISEKIENIEEYEEMPEKIPLNEISESNSSDESDTSSIISLESSENLPNLCSLDINLQSEMEKSNNFHKNIPLDKSLEFHDDSLDYLIKAINLLNNDPTIINNSKDIIINNFCNEINNLYKYSNELVLNSETLRDIDIQLLFFDRDLENHPNKPNNYLIARDILEKILKLQRALLIKNSKIEPNFEPKIIPHYKKIIYKVDSKLNLKNSKNNHKSKFANYQHKSPCKNKKKIFSEKNIQKLINLTENIQKNYPQKKFFSLIKKKNVKFNIATNKGKKIIRKIENLFKKPKRKIFEIFRKIKRTEKIEKLKKKEINEKKSLKQNDKKNNIEIENSNFYKKTEAFKNLEIENSKKLKNLKKNKEKKEDNKHFSTLLNKKNNKLDFREIHSAELSSEKNIINQNYKANLFKKFKQKHNEDSNFQYNEGDYIDSNDDSDSNIVFSALKSKNVFNSVNKNNNPNEKMIKNYNIEYDTEFMLKKLTPLRGCKKNFGEKNYYDDSEKLFNIFNTKNCGEKNYYDDSEKLFKNIDKKIIENKNDGNQTGYFDANNNEKDHNCLSTIENCQNIDFSKINNPKNNIELKNSNKNENKTETSENESISEPEEPKKLITSNDFYKILASSSPEKNLKQIFSENIKKKDENKFFKNQSIINSLSEKKRDFETKEKSNLDNNQTLPNELNDGSFQNYRNNERLNNDNNFESNEEKNKINKNNNIIHKKNRFLSPQNYLYQKHSYFDYYQNCKIGPFEHNYFLEKNNNEVIMNKLNNEKKNNKINCINHKKKEKKYIKVMNHQRNIENYKKSCDSLKPSIDLLEKNELNKDNNLNKKENMIKISLNKKKIKTFKKNSLENEGKSITNQNNIEENNQTKNNFFFKNNINNQNKTQSFPKYNINSNTITSNNKLLKKSIKSDIYSQISDDDQLFLREGTLIKYLSGFAYKIYHILEADNISFCKNLMRSKSQENVHIPEYLKNMFEEFITVRINEECKIANPLDKNKFEDYVKLKEMKLNFEIKKNNWILEFLSMIKF